MRLRRFKSPSAAVDQCRVRNRDRSSHILELPRESTVGTAKSCVCTCRRGETEGQNVTPSHRVIF